MTSDRFPQTTTHTKNKLNSAVSVPLVPIKAKFHKFTIGYTICLQYFIQYFLPQGIPSCSYIVTILNVILILTTISSKSRFDQVVIEFHWRTLILTDTLNNIFTVPKCDNEGIRYGPPAHRMNIGYKLNNLTSGTQYK